MDDRAELLSRYRETHGRHVGGAVEEQARWFRRHLDLVYSPHMPPPETGPAVLEIACGAGYLLEALRDRGYEDLTGVDMSESGVRAARARAPEATLVEADAARFLDDPPAAYDVVLAKAFFEHVPKGEIIALLRAVRTALRPGGVVLIEVPNMDWLLAGHERYMDFTHEVGFTRESLAQLLRTVYDDAHVYPVPPTELRGPLHRAARTLVWPVARGAFRAFLRLAGGYGEETLWEYRSILGVARTSGR